jgi:acylphosphatase
VDDLGHLRMIVRGRVQGVFFRRATADEALGLALKGFVRNLPDGSVEIVAEGSHRNLEMLAAWAHTGPPYARVDHVDIQWSDFRNEFSAFSVR